jgi:hypothetical protein
MEELLQQRYDKFRRMGVFLEQQPGTASPDEKTSGSTGVD